MRRLTHLSILLASLLSTLLLASEQREPIKPEAGQSPSLRLQAALAADTFRALKKAGVDVTYLRFLDYRDFSADDLEDSKALLSWWVHQLSFEQTSSLPRDVDGAPYLQLIDIRDYRWTVKGFQAVAERDPYSHEPGAGHADAEYLRDAIGVQVTEGLAEKGLFPLEAIVNAEWFFRETIESDRSQSYYDLLFSRKRFGDDGKPRAPPRQAVAPRLDLDALVLVERGGVLREIKRREAGPGEAIFRRVPGTNRLTADQAREEVKAAVKAQAGARANFPANIKDWEEAFGIDLSKDFARKEKLDFDYGAIAEGSLNNERNGSMVALNDRLLVTQPAASGKIAMRSFDVEENVGKKDYIERTPDLPFDIRDDKVVFDAGELLAYLPNGGQAAMLINGKGDRVEIAGTKVANDTADKRMNPGVRNPGSCVICHAPQGGFIVPRNLVEVYLNAGVDTKIADREKYLRFKGFFLKWQKRIAPFREDYNELLAETTKRGGKAGWDNAKLVKVFQGTRDRYDDPVTVARAARGLGCKEEQVKTAAARSPTNRQGMLNRGGTIPRRTWEKTVYRDLQNRLSIGEK